MTDHRPPTTDHRRLTKDERLRGRALDCSHYLAEEAADETFAELYAFFAGA